MAGWISKVPLFLCSTVLAASLAAVALGTSTTSAAVTVSPGVLTGDGGDDTFTITIDFANGNRVCHGQTGGGLSGPCDWNPGLAGEQAHTSSVSVNGGGGNDTLHFDDTGAVAPGYHGSYFVNANSLVTNNTTITFADIDHLMVTGSPNGDGIGVAVVPAGRDLLIDLGGGNDNAVLGSQNGDFNNLQGPITINGGPGTDGALQIYDVNAPGAQTYTLTNTTIQRSGAAQITYGTWERVDVHAGGGGDTIDLSAVGAGGDFRLNGNGGADTITGSSGADTIVGGLGGDHLFGGPGADVFTWNPGDGSDDIDGGDGQDRLDFNGAAAAETIGVEEVPTGFRVKRSLGTVSIDPVANLELLQIDAAGGDDILDVIPLAGTAMVLIGGSQAGQDILNVDRRCWRSALLADAIITTPGFQNIAQTGFEVVTNENMVAMFEISSSFGHLTMAGTLTVVDYSDDNSCAWEAIPSALWVAVNGNNTGPGDKTVGWSVPTNLGAERTATISVNGNLFTLTQAANPNAIIRIGSVADARFGDEWTLDGSNMTDTRAKLLNPANFGSGGVVNKDVVIEDVGETPGSITLNLLRDYDIFFIGYFDDGSSNAFTPGELKALREWVMEGGHLMVTCDEQSYDAVCSAMGFPAGSGSGVNGTANPPLAGPFGSVTSFQMAGDHDSFATTEGGQVVAVDENGAPVVILRENVGCGTVSLFADVDIFSNDTLSSGAAIDPNNGNDKLLGNMVAALAAVGPRKGCGSFPLVAGATAAPWYGPPVLAADIETSLLVPASVSAIFQWDNQNQVFDFWFRGFPANFNTLTPGLVPGGFYFFQSPGGDTVVAGLAGSVQPPAHVPFPTVVGATGQLWTGGPLLLADLEALLPQEVSAVFRWDNSGQLFEFWFRGFPLGFQTLDRGIRWVEYYFFQSSTAGVVGN